MYALVWTATFARTAKRFAQRHPELRQKFAAVLHDLENDPFQPHLHYHRLGGKLQDLAAVSITYSYRITLIVEITEKEIILLDVGSHDAVCR